MENEERKNPKPKLEAWEKLEAKMVKNPTTIIPHDLVETILLKLPIKSLVKFNCVSKEWNSMIMSQHFKKRHLINHQRSHDPNILFVWSKYDSNEICVNTLTLRSSVYVENPSYYQPFSYESSVSVTRSCDGLICFYCFMQSLFVIINPSINWYRSLPYARLQILLQDRPENRTISKPLPPLGLGKDKISGVYKLVWLYNSKEFGLDNITTCEVFSFNTNTWRNVTASPYQVDYGCLPIYVDGSLHWLSQIYNSERHIVSFDLYTEAFEVNLKIPFTTDGPVSTASLNDRLCISETKNMKQEIWSLSSSKEWEKTYSLDTASILFDSLRILPTQIITTFQKTKIVLKSCNILGRGLVIHNQELNSYGVAYKSKHLGVYVAYFPSLITV